MKLTIDNLRPCRVAITKKEKKNALFHMWINLSQVVSAGITIGSHPAGQNSATLGLVEFEDGSVKEVNPERIVFLDNKHSEYGFDENRFMPGDEVYVIERDETETPFDYSCYIYLATTAHGVIASTFINNVEKIDDTVQYHIDETISNQDTHLCVFDMSDCFKTADAAQEFIRNFKREDGE